LVGYESIARLVGWVEDHFIDDGVGIISIDLTEVTEIDLGGVGVLGVLLTSAGTATRRRGARHGPIELLTDVMVVLTEARPELRSGRLVAPGCRCP
jgi:hypothetical protein